MRDEPADLADLAELHGVATTFGDWQGGAAAASTAAIRCVLAALGVDASDAAATRRALDDARLDAWRRMLPVYLVARAGRATRVAMHVPDGEPAALVVELEDGTRRELPQLMIWVDPREVDGTLVGEATFEIPDDVPLGYHALHAFSGARRARCHLLVVPDRIAVPAGRAWGFTLQLYQARSRRSWAIGDLHDLGDLVSWSADLGAGFVLVNPLHAAAPVPPMEASPYYPASRRFLNPLYLRVEDVVEVSALPRSLVASFADPLRAANDTDAPLDRDGVWAAKRRVLEKAFAGRRESPSGAGVGSGVATPGGFDAFVAEQGEPLIDFATWCALAERHGLPWQSWPAELRDARSVEVGAFRGAHRDLVDFHCWLQWLCALQLADVQRAARDAGMTLGVVHDLAVGVDPDGADAWSLRGLLATGVALGAPADMYNQRGQCWNLPAWRPDKLAEVAFAPFRDLVRAVLARGGGLRIDHIIGLFRQWWVPVGASASDGTYVRLDHEAMIGIVLLEAQRAGAIVVGEDLGNVEPWVRDYLRERGVLGTSILWFEHDEAGHPRPPEQWRELCLATVTTHDLPPSAGYLTGRHVDIRAELGLLKRSADVERAVDAEERQAWIEALCAAGLLDRAVAAAGAESRVDQIVDALHAYVARTPALLVGVYLPDVVGDRRPINQPGTTDQYPNWRLPMTDGTGRPVVLEDLFASARAKRLAHVVTDPWASVTVASAGDPPP